MKKKEVLIGTEVASVGRI